MQDIRWELYPAVAGDQYARGWLQLQAMLGLSPNTVHAYARGLHDYLAYSNDQSKNHLSRSKR